MFSLVALLLVASSLHICSAADNSWDYLLYVTRWPGTEGYGELIPDNITDFVIHGMWPTRNDGSWPQYCTNEKFDPSQISDLVGDLDEYWHDFQNDPFGFWSHEWTRHGTCASQINSLHSQHQFFNQGISFAENYILISALKSVGITPSNTTTYSPSDISNAVTKKFGHIPVLQCEKVSGLGLALWRINLCFNKSLQLQTCPTSAFEAVKDSSCSSNVYIPPVTYQ